MTRLDLWKRTCVFFVLCTATALASYAQSFTVLYSFDESNDAFPQGTLVQGEDGNFYGMSGINTIFSISANGLLSTLFTFNGPNGDAPTGLVMGRDGNFYGTTEIGGANGIGTIFKLTPSGTLTTLHNFNLTDGGAPFGGVIQATDGNFYGTTEEGGGGSCTRGGCGTVYRCGPEGDFTVLHRFTKSVTDGSSPFAGLVQATDGNFYGTTAAGGAHNRGTVFRINSRGAFTLLHSFKGTDGEAPYAPLIEGMDEYFYGATVGGGVYNDGTIFRMGRTGQLSTLHSFDFTDGGFPFSSLVQGSDGNFYGATEGGGMGDHCVIGYGCGTLFTLTSADAFEKVHDFFFSDGLNPGGLLQATNGLFYGLATSGGLSECDNGYGCGTAFSLDMGLGPFVAFVRDSGNVGGSGGILGQGFTGVSDVSVDGTPAKFKVMSDTFLKATVPAGATTGFVTVTTPSGTLTSNKPFRVTPQLLSFDPPSGPVGTQVAITGVSLTQTQFVGFGDRVPAQFTVNSDTQVTATVPAGAKTGKIGAETKGGIAISSGTFTVTP